MMRLGREPACAGFALALLAAPAGAQLPSIRSAPAQWVGAPIEDYVRLLQLTGVMPLSSQTLRPTDVAMNFTPPDSARWRAPWSRFYNDATLPKDTGLVTVQLFDPELRSTYNSTVPYGTNDGAMWAGRGVSGIVRAGGKTRVGPVTLQIVPEYTWSKNNYVELGQVFFNPINASPYADRWLSRDIDLPQRFGERALSRTDPGQSRLSVEKYGVKLGVSTENMWWGPGMENALLMTNHAPGFVHTILGTSKPVNVGIGKLEVLHTLGWLKQSDYWRVGEDTFPTDRWINALGLVFEPKGAPGMYFGASRMLYAYETHNPITFREIASALIESLEKAPLAAAADSGRDDIRDQMLSFWFRWVFPLVGFEAYGEWGRNDHAWDRRDLILEPDHSRAYLVGVRKIFKLREGVLSLRGETTDLGRTRTMFHRATPIWYTHHLIRQGYTNRGQVVGAGIGPGGDQQAIAADWYYSRGSLGLVVQRQQVSSDGLYKAYTTKDGGFFNHHDVFIGAGPRLSLQTAWLDLSLSFLQQKEYGRHNIAGNDFENSHLEMRAIYRWR